MEQFLEHNQNPVLRVKKDGIVLYSNETSRPLLHEWGTKVGEKLPSSIVDIVQKVITQNSPEKMEVKAGIRIYLIVFHPLPEQGCVNISGFDISEQKEIEGKPQGTEAWEMANLDLVDILDVPAIQSLMEDLYELTHITIALVDLKGNILVGVGYQDICTKFHRVHPETCKHCVESDTRLSLGVSPGEFKLYKCKNNMWDVATPVMVSGKHVANIFSGQFFFEGELLDYELFRSQARQYGFNEKEYIAALEKVPRLSRETVNKSMSFFMKLANMISQLSHSNFKLAQSLVESDILVNKLNKNKVDLDLAQAVGNLGNWRLNVRKNELTWSDEAHRIFSIPKGTPLTYENFLSTVHADDRKFVDKKWKAGLAGEPYDIEHRIIVDNEVKWVREKAYIEFDNDGMLLGGFGITQDITERKRAEDALRLSNLYNRSLIEASLDPLVTIGYDGKITDVNSATEQITGYSRNELIGTDFSDYFTEPEKANAGYQQVFKHGEVRDYPLEIKHKEGNITPVLYNASVYRDENGKVIGVFAAARDITERKQAEEEIQGTKNMLQLVMNNIPQGIFWKDHNSRYMGCNKVFAKATGIESPENIVGKTDYDLPWSPEQIEWFREYDHRIMENDTPAYQIVESMREADGELAWVETNKVPLHDAKGNVIGILGTYEDITERKKAEEAVRLSNLYNRSLIEVSLDPLVTIGHDGKITDVNSATEQVTGYSRDDLIGTDFSDYFIEPEKARAGYQQVFKDGEVRDYPLEIKHKDGHITPVLYHASVYRDENGKVIGVFAAARDITERKKAEEALKRAHESLEEKVKERTSELEEAYNTLNESEKGLAEAQKMAHIGNWEWDIATDKAHWSEEMYRIFKRDPQKLAPSLKEYYDYIHPDDLDYYCKVNDYTRKVPTFGLDFRIVLANGEERTLHIKSDFIFSDENIPIRVKGIVQDITEQKRAEEKLQTLANAVESSSDAIITLSLDGIITSWNKAAEQVYGYSAQEVIGKSVSILAPSHLREETKKLTETVIQGEKVHQYETLRLRKDDTIINVSITFSPVFDNTGKLVAISGIVRDVTERIKAEEALRESEAHLRQFYESDMFGSVLL